MLLKLPSRLPQSQFFLFRGPLPLLVAASEVHFVSHSPMLKDWIGKYFLTPLPKWIPRTFDREKNPKDDLRGTEQAMYHSIYSPLSRYDEETPNAYLRPMTAYEAARMMGESTSRQLYVRVMVGDRKLS
jgi:hypothetical protein